MCLCLLLTRSCLEVGFCFSLCPMTEPLWMFKKSDSGPRKFLPRTRREAENARRFCCHCRLNRLERKGAQIGFGPAPRQCFFVSSCWPTSDHIRRSTRNSNPVMTSSAGGAKGCSDHRFRAPPAGYTAQLLTLHQHRANNQWIGRLIKSSRL